MADLHSYGETATADWFLLCSDDEMARTLSVASWLLHNAPGPPSGSSILISQACALAAGYIHEGHPRELIRRRRDLSVWRAVAESTSTDRPAALPSVPNEYGVGLDARAYWKRPDVSAEADGAD